ncbi:MAG: HAMP domain-containing histidine kinase [Leptospiraceae bacterium]|nr:HAMP domain-containing histidine kinase [Leptospiraceae bacterium]MDW7975313.1 HAMP domain-containing sensor histidine kinase [Leptospiraceae bacterium]
MKFFFFLVLPLFFSFTPMWGDCIFRVYDFQKPYLELKGKWKFFKGSGNIASNPNIDDSDWTRVSVPFLWKDIDVLENYIGEIWLRCSIEFYEIPQELYFDLGEVKEIDEVYWNGQKIGGLGDFEKKIPDFSERRIYEVPPSLIQNQNVVAIRLYGTWSEAGLPDVPTLYFTSQPVAKKQKYEFFALVFSITYLITSVFFMIYGWFTKEPANFYFSLFTIILSFYHIIIEGFRYHLFENFLLSYVVELLLLIPLPFLFLTFLKVLLNTRLTFFYRFVGYFSLFLFVITLVSSLVPHTYKTLVLYAITYINLINLMVAVVEVLRLFLQIEIRKKLAYIWFGILSMIPFIAMDILITIELLSFPKTFVFGYSVFLVSFAIQLSKRATQLKELYHQQEVRIKQSEKQKLNIIYNVSSKFHSMFAELEENIKQKKDPESSILKTQVFLESLQILTSLEQKKYIPQPAKINLKEEIEKIIQLVLRTTKQKKHRIQAEIPSAFFWMDINLFKFILYHLLENALLYSKDVVGCNVEIGSSENQYEDILILKITDNGIGIAKDQVDKIFTKYYRGHDHSIPGAGIGLTLVKEAVEFLHGTVSVDSKPFFYTIFEVQIPSLREVQ